MVKKMLIDATHAEETRVVVVDGTRVEEFDFESENKRQLAGNIYLAKVTRVEPSLQAAFIDYGGNRHGFLAFSEIHPDYYQIPVADRKALMEEERAYAEAMAKEDDAPKPKRRRRRSKTKAEEVKSTDAVQVKEAEDQPAVSGMDVVDLDEPVGDAPVETPPVAEEGQGSENQITETQQESDAAAQPESDAPAGAEAQSEVSQKDADQADADAEDGDEDDSPLDAADKDDRIESVADDDAPEDIRPPRKPRPRRYKIQEVIKVRQILLVQVVKEERGNKGAALTTYLSLAGRYCVLMPNTARGGGISRKITNAADRKKLKAIATEIDIPQGAGLIVRTAGAKRTKSEIKRDYEYLQRLWEQIRTLTLESTAPAQIYEEGNLIKRSIRDLYDRQIDEVLVEGEAGYRVAKDFMKMIMPSHAKNVKNYHDTMPLFSRYQVENYLSGMFNPTVQLKSGGYIVIGVTEALVAIDVNSGRATKENSIEETALKTNLEASDEVARQLRLRDLAGLIVIDYIDMDERRNNNAVEKRLKDQLKNDRARIQVGRISGFGLLEMSRQRLRPGMIEAITQPCAHCHGTGSIRSDENLSLSILRQLEEEGTRKRSREVLLKAPVDIVNYLFNYKREHIAGIEARYGMAVRIESDPSLVNPDFSIEKFKTASRRVKPAPSFISSDSSIMEGVDQAAEAAENAESPIAETPATETPTTEGEQQPPKKRRRRRRRRSWSGEAAEQSNAVTTETEVATQDQPEGEAQATEAPEVETAAPEAEVPAEAPKPKRKRAPRKSSKAKAEAEAATEVEADAKAAPEAEAASDAEVLPETEAPAKKKPTRRRKTATKKADEAKPSDEVKPEESTEAEPKADADEKAKKPRKTAKKAAGKSAKKPAEKAEDDSAEKPAEVASEPVEDKADSVEAKPAAKKRTRRKPAKKADTPAEQPAKASEPSEPKPEPEAEKAPRPAPEPKPDTASDGPKKKGWWSLKR
ncbi:MAG: ribonuclease [Rhodobacterales bacterium]|nr:MAG: ribonuclease [Rhodobacterales bacterium]